MPLGLSFINRFVFSDDNLNFGIKTLEEIKLKKLKEKTKKQGGELISPTFLSCLLFPFCPFFFFFCCYYMDSWLCIGEYNYLQKKGNFLALLGSDLEMIAADSCLRVRIPCLAGGLELLWHATCFLKLKQLVF